MPLFVIQVVLYAVEFAIYVVPLASIYVLLNWHKVNEMVRHVCQLIVSHIFSNWAKGYFDR